MSDEAKMVAKDVNLLDDLAVFMAENKTEGDIEFPVEVSSISHRGALQRPSAPVGSWVSVRPASDTKTYLGVYLGDQCVAAGVPFFFKQWGEWAPSAQQADYSRKGAAFTRIDVAGNTCTDPTRWSASDALFYRCGKKAAGHLLDGQEWHQFPERA